MRANSINMFLKLYQKEMTELKAEIIITVLAVIMTTSLLYILGARLGWTTGLALMAAGFAGLLPLITATKIFEKEWNNNTIYLIMSLPVRGGMILGSKLAAVVSQYLIGTITVLVSWAIIIRYSFPNEVALVVNEINGTAWALGFSLYGLTIALGIYLISLIFFSQMTARLVNRFRGLVTFITFFTLFVISNKLISPWKWHGGINGGAFIPPVEPFLINSLIYLGAAAIIFLGAVIIYNQRVEL